MGITCPQAATPGKRLMLFKAMSGRSREDFQKSLKGFRFKLITADRCATYSEEFLSEVFGEEVLIQRCLDHLKRPLLTVMANPESIYFKDAYEQSVQKLKDGLSAPKLNDAAVIYVVMTAYSMIAACEREFREEHPLPENEEQQKDYYALLKAHRQMYEARWADVIERGMVYLYKEYQATKYDESAKKFVNVSNRFYTKAVTYFMNSKDEFRTFLDHPEVDPTNNLVLYRQNRYADKLYSKPCKFSSSINNHRHNILARDCNVASTIGRSPNKIGTVNYAATIKCKGTGLWDYLFQPQLWHIRNILDVGLPTKYYADIFMTQWRNYQHLRALCRHNDFVGITRIMPISA